MLGIALGQRKQGDARCARQRRHMHRAGIIPDREERHLCQRHDLEQIGSRHQILHPRLGPGKLLCNLPLCLSANHRRYHTGIRNPFGQFGIVLQGPAFGFAVF